MWRAILRVLSVVGALFAGAKGWRSNEYSSLEKMLGYRFKDRSLLVKALTHRSYVHENVGKTDHYEQLEFIGDSVLDLIIGRELIKRYPDATEGDLTRMRSSLVNERSLSQIAKSLGIGSLMNLGKGEDQTGGREKASLLSDCLEAVVGAVYIDGGYHGAEKVVIRIFSDRLSRMHEGEFYGDFKSQLQEMVQRRFKVLPQYVVTGSSGPPHARIYRVELRVNGRKLAEGKGRSKKEAEQDAARRAVKVLQHERLFRKIK